jgi:hypothetical protein
MYSDIKNYTITGRYLERSEKYNNAEFQFYRYNVNMYGNDCIISVMEDTLKSNTAYIKRLRTLESI